MKKANHDTIPMNLPVVMILLFLIFPLCIYICITWNDQTFYVQSGCVITILVCLYGFIENSRSFQLSSSGIQCCICNIPFRKISWNQVSQIGIARRSDGLKGSHFPFLIISLKGADEFNPFYDKGGSYVSRNSGYVYTIYDPDKYVSIIEKYYGPIDYDIRRYES